MFSRFVPLRSVAGCEVLSGCFVSGIRGIEFIDECLEGGAAGCCIRRAIGASPGAAGRAFRAEACAEGGHTLRAVHARRFNVGRLAEGDRPFGGSRDYARPNFNPVHHSP
jgi:hypothetical protein